LERKHPFIKLLSVSSHTVLAMNIIKYCSMPLIHSSCR